MDPGTSQAIRQVWAKVNSPEGLSFPMTVGALMKLGVQRYHVDYVAMCITAYKGNQSDTAPMLQHLSSVPPGVPWNADALVAAIKKAQAGEGNYHDFSAAMLAAGVTNYFAYLDGRKLLYLGALGDSHVELFPSAPAS